MVLNVLVHFQVYQFRHPDISQTAHIVFLVIGLALVLQVLSYFTDHLAFWILFVIGYILLVLVFVFLVVLPPPPRPLLPVLLLVLFYCS